MNTSATPPPPTANHCRERLMHMTFFWGTDALILFSGWLGRSAAMYVATLLLTFLVAFLVEFISDVRPIRSGTNRAAAAIAQASMYGVRMGLAYLVMLAVMSFNGGFFLAAISGHMVGYWFFGSRRE